MFREAPAERGAPAQLRPETWRAPQRCASHAAHRRAHTRPRTRPPPARRRLPPTEASSHPPPPGGSGGAPAPHHARQGVSCWCDGGAPGGPPSRTHSPARGASRITPARVLGAQGARPGGRTGQAGGGRGWGCPGLAPPELPWFPGGRTRSPGRCGWPRHPVRSPSRSSQSWWARRAASTPSPDGPPAAGGRLRGAGRRSGDPGAPLRRLLLLLLPPPHEPQEKPAQTKRALTPGRGRRKFPGGPGRAEEGPARWERDAPGGEERGSAEDAARSPGRRDAGTRG